MSKLDALLSDLGDMLLDGGGDQDDNNNHDAAGGVSQADQGMISSNNDHQTDTSANNNNLAAVFEKLSLSRTSGQTKWKERFVTLNVDERLLCVHRAGGNSTNNNDQPISTLSLSSGTEVMVEEEDDTYFILEIYSGPQSSDLSNQQQQQGEDDDGNGNGRLKVWKLRSRDSDLVYNWLLVIQEIIENMDSVVAPPVPAVVSNYAPPTNSNNLLNNRSASNGSNNVTGRMTESPDVGPTITNNNSGQLPFPPPNRKDSAVRKRVPVPLAPVLAALSNSNAETTLTGSYDSYNSSRPSQDSYGRPSQDSFGYTASPRQPPNNAMYGNNGIMNAGMSSMNAGMSSMNGGGGNAFVHNFAPQLQQGNFMNAMGGGGPTPLTTRFNSNPTSTNAPSSPITGANGVAFFNPAAAARSGAFLSPMNSGPSNSPSPMQNPQNPLQLQQLPQQMTNYIQSSFPASALHPAYLTASNPYAASNHDHPHTPPTPMSANSGYFNNKRPSLANTLGSGGDDARSIKSTGSNNASHAQHSMDAMFLGGGPGPMSPVTPMSNGSYGSGRKQSVASAGEGSGGLFSKISTGYDGGSVYSDGRNSEKERKKKEALHMNDLMMGGGGGMGGPPPGMGGRSKSKKGSGW